MPYEIVTQFPLTWSVPDDAAIVITHMHYRWEDVGALRRIMSEGKVPVLILADGILEYRNIFEHPEQGDGSLFQPIVGHKMAVLGRGQARVLESWGNIGKCEVVGSPRIDALLENPAPPVQQAGPFRLLIATANTPAFDARQREAVVESLRLIQQRFEHNKTIDDRPVEINWRLSKGLEQDLGLPEPPPKHLRSPISGEIDASDAVIVTPSTMFLESLLKLRPTALLDFHNKPHYVPSAWMINAPKHLNQILYELARPPAAKMLFQQTVLHDQLECLTPAVPRLLQLIAEMVRIGGQQRSQNRPLEFPPRILVDPQRGFAHVEPDFDMARLYPKNHFFRSQDVAWLTQELNLAVSRLQGMPEENSRVMVRMDEFRTHCDWLRNRNEELIATNKDLRERIGKLRAHLSRLAGDLDSDDDPKKTGEDG